MDSVSKVKTRIAPTPSGYLHLGNVLSFAITAGLAERTGAKILLRIDDLDRSRIRKRYVQDVFDTLNFLEIPWHEGPADITSYERAFSQRHRMTLYEQALQHLKERGKVFACICSRADIIRSNRSDSAMKTELSTAYPGTCRDMHYPYERQDVSWRLRTDRPQAPHAKLPDSMQDLIVRRKDGLPAYQLASVIDDLHFKINLVVRGEDLRESTLAQCHLSEVLEETGFTGAGNFSKAKFHHHTLLKHSGGEKFCKSTGTALNATYTVHHLRKQGKKRKDVFALIGSILQLAEPPADWQSLATMAILRTNQSGANARPLPHLN